MMQTDLKTPVQAAPPGVERKSPIPGLRWWVCGLIFLATTINYVDRTSLSALKTTLEKIFKWDEADYGWIMFFFSTAYAIFPSFAGRLIDGVGVKVGLALALILWSAMAGAHALVGGLVGFCVVRFFLGAAEAANFPAAIKAVAQWFPQKERALATGLFNSGTNIGVMMMPLLVALAGKTSWKMAFVAIAVMGLLWLIFWFMLYSNSPEDHPRISEAEKSYIRAGLPRQQEAKLNIHWTLLLRYKQVWPFLIGKFLTDPVWWFYLYWLMPWLSKERHLTPDESARMLLFPYTAATIGSILGGWISGHLIKKGWKVGSARYIAMFGCAVFMPGAIIAGQAGSPLWLSMLLISLATASHQGWSANIFTTATDLFPSKVAGSVVGLGATTGAIGSMFMTLLVGITLQWLDGSTYKYLPIFIWAGLMHPLSWVIYRFIAGPELNQVDVDRGIDSSMMNKPLITGGVLAIIFGTILASVVLIKWNTIIVMMNKSVAATAGGVTAGVLLAVIGMALTYAGLPRRQARR